MFKKMLPLVLLAALCGCTDFTQELDDYYRTQLSPNDSLENIKCDSKNEGEDIIVMGSKNEVFTCEDGTWVGDKGDSVLYEPSSSSKAKVGSSESKTGRSSSSAKVSEAKSSSSKVYEPSEPIIIEPESSSTSLGSCVLKQEVAFKGEPVNFMYVFSDVANDFSIMEIARAKFEWDYGEGIAEGKSTTTLSDAVTFKKSGDYSIQVTAKIADQEETTSCSVHVNGAPITGCECTAKESIVDLAKNDVASWIVSGCTTTAEIIDYEWTDAKGNGSSASYSFKEKGEIVSPFVRVANDDNTAVEIACSPVKSINSDEPDYTISERNVEVELSAGVSVLAMNLQDSEYGCEDEYSVYFRCSFDRYADKTTVILDGESYPAYSTFGAYIPCENAKDGYLMEIELENPATCWVTD